MSQNVGRMYLVCRMTMLVDGLSSVVDKKMGFPNRQIRSSRFFRYIDL